MNFNFLWITFIAILGLNLVFFVIAFFLQKDYFTDATFSISFIFSVSFNFIFGYHQFNILKTIVFIIVNLWALRLMIYLVCRILKIKVDHRFDQFRNHWFKFLGFWVAQGFLAFLLTLPANFVLNLKIDNPKFNFLNLIFITLWLGGFLIETISDQQKFTFLNNNKNKLLDCKLWKISRHPNYFGELVQWYMICFLAIFNLLTNKFAIKKLFYLLLIVSPLFLNISLLFWSGLPKLETSLYQRYHNDLNYQKYIKKTSIIIPFLGKKNHILKIRKIIYKNKR